MGFLRDFIDGLLNPYKNETDIEREERHRKEDRQHELNLAEIRSGANRENRRSTYKRSSSRRRYDDDHENHNNTREPLERELEFLDSWGNKKRK